MKKVIMERMELNDKVIEIDIEKKKKEEKEKMGIEINSMDEEDNYLRVKQEEE